MDRCVVRRAIKETQTGKVIGYELLFQGNKDNLFAQPETTAADMISSFLMSNSNKFVSDKTMFITFTPSLLFRNTPKMFEPGKVVIQVDDNLVVNPLAKPFLKKYHKAGYQIAVSDFQFSLRYLDMLDDVSYIRLDMHRKEIYENEKEKNSLKNIIAMARGVQKKCIAVNVDSKEIYQCAVELEVDYLEGNYIARTLITKTDRVTFMEGNFFQLLVEVSKPEPDISQVEQIISRDAGLTFSLLKLVNSAYFALRRRTSSIRQALVTLGIGQLRQWVYMLSFRQDVGSPALEELLKLSFLRAKFASELVNYVKKCPITNNEAYMMGMFSTMEYMVDAPIEEILEKIPLNSVVEEALVLGNGVVGNIYKLILSYERADWKVCKALAEELGVPTYLLAQIYIDCVENVNTIWNTLTTEYVRKGEKPLFSEKSDNTEHIEDILK
ncbi:EAL and HDOD domain-containing protein [Clostridium sp. C105KSO13]|uniref:EAL and HDOD domain-containing protein n=1 Tax=Clostridium sp. C105KSO13 TaxID=1776045 RepID=UPI0007405C72|nr:HDOD domain-containing protein [Clostridium sp. C105KSO13]CUX49499.1 HDOD domain protein [Clostridium sp. C105KSO13]